MSESLRDSLEAVSAGATTEAPVEATPEPSTDATPAPEVAAESATPAPVREGRDDKGRFAPKASTAGTKDAGQAAPTSPPAEGAASSTPPPKQAETTQTEPPRPGEPDTTMAPPQWKVGARNNWDKVPADIRQEVWRRERETEQALSRSVPARQFYQEMEKTLGPILPALQARGTTPQRLIASYVDFDKALSSRDPAAQAQAVAQVIKGYGIPVEALADALDGKAQPTRGREPTVEEIRAEIRREMQDEFRTHAQQSEARTHATRVQEFAKKADPVLFNEDVRHDMAALIESAAARGVELSLQDAYDRAIKANPDAWAIVQQREQAKLAPTQQQATARAQAAGSSVKTRPASPVGGESSGASLRSDLEAEAARMNGRL